MTIVHLASHVMSRKVSFKQAKLFSSKSFLNFSDSGSRFLINWCLIKKTCSILFTALIWYGGMNCQKIKIKHFYRLIRNFIFISLLYTANCRVGKKFKPNIFPPFITFIFRTFFHNYQWPFEGVKKSNTVFHTL